MTHDSATVSHIRITDNLYSADLAGLLVADFDPDTDTDGDLLEERAEDLADSYKAILLASLSEHYPSASIEIDVDVWHRLGGGDSRENAVAITYAEETPENPIYPGDDTGWVDDLRQSAFDHALDVLSAEWEPDL